MTHFILTFNDGTEEMNIEVAGKTIKQVLAEMKEAGWQTEYIVNIKKL